jgi:serine/threonine protein kinase
VKQFPNATNLGLNKFKKLEAIGRGGFGKVFIVEKNGEQFAMKEMVKA